MEGHLLFISPHQAVNLCLSLCSYVCPLHILKIVHSTRHHTGQMRCWGPKRVQCWDWSLLDELLLRNLEMVQNLLQDVSEMFSTGTAVYLKNKESLCVCMFVLCISWEPLIKTTSQSLSGLLGSQGHTMLNLVQFGNMICLILGGAVNINTVT